MRRPGCAVDATQLSAAQSVAASGLMQRVYGLARRGCDERGFQPRVRWVCRARPRLLDSSLRLTYDGVVSKDSAISLADSSPNARNMDAGTYVFPKVPET